MKGLRKLLAKSIVDVVDGTRTEMKMSPLEGLGLASALRSALDV